MHRGQLRLWMSLTSIWIIRYGVAVVSGMGGFFNVSDWPSSISLQSSITTRFKGNFSLKFGTTAIANLSSVSTCPCSALPFLECVTFFNAGRQERNAIYSQQGYFSVTITQLYSGQTYHQIHSESLFLPIICIHINLWPQLGLPDVYRASWRCCKGRNLGWTEPLVVKCFVLSAVRSDQVKSDSCIDAVQLITHNRLNEIIGSYCKSKCRPGSFRTQGVRLS